MEHHALLYWLKELQACSVQKVTAGISIHEGKYLWAWIGLALDTEQPQIVGEGEHGQLVNRKEHAIQILEKKFKNTQGVA